MRTGEVVLSFFPQQDVLWAVLHAAEMKDGTTQPHRISVMYERANIAVNAQKQVKKTNLLHFGMFL